MKIKICTKAIFVEDDECNDILRVNFDDRDELDKTLIGLFKIMGYGVEVKDCRSIVEDSEKDLDCSNDRFIHGKYYYFDGVSYVYNKNRNSLLSVKSALWISSDDFWSLTIGLMADSFIHGTYYRLNGANYIYNSVTDRLSNGNGTNYNREDFLSAVEYSNINFNQKGV